MSLEKKKCKKNGKKFLSRPDFLAGIWPGKYVEPPYASKAEQYHVQMWLLTGLGSHPLDRICVSDLVI
jgi:hypothetical protein